MVLRSLCLVRESNNKFKKSEARMRDEECLEQGSGREGLL
jgi:hypothetical protein